MEYNGICSSTEIICQVVSYHANSSSKACQETRNTKLVKGFTLQPYQAMLKWPKALKIDLMQVKTVAKMDWNDSMLSKNKHAQMMARKQGTKLNSQIQLKSDEHESMAKI